MELLKAEMQDIADIMILINHAKKHLFNQGIDQWQTGYPDTLCIEQDIHNLKGYKVMIENHLAGYLCIDFDGEPSYDKLQGTWLTQLPYAVIHRMTLDDSFRGKGLSTSVFHMVENLCIQKNIFSIRVDTDEANTSMRHILTKIGFTFCGHIWFDNSDKIAFEKPLQ